MFFFILNLAVSTLIGFMATVFGATTPMAIVFGIIAFVVICMIRFGAGGGLDDAFDVLSD